MFVVSVTVLFLCFHLLSISFQSFIQIRILYLFLFQSGFIIIMIMLIIQICFAAGSTPRPRHPLILLLKTNGLRHWFQILSNLHQIVARFGILVHFLIPFLQIQTVPPRRHWQRQFIKAFVLHSHSSPLHYFPGIHFLNLTSRISIFLNIIIQ